MVYIVPENPLLTIGSDSAEVATLKILQEKEYEVYYDVAARQVDSGNHVVFHLTWRGSFSELPVASMPVLGCRNS